MNTPDMSPSSADAAAQARPTLLLVAHRLSFEHPVLKVPMRIQAPLGPEVLGLFARLGWPASESDYGA